MGHCAPNAVTAVTDRSADCFLPSLTMNSEGKPYSQAIQMGLRLEQGTFSVWKARWAGIVRVMALILTLASCPLWTVGQSVTEKCGPHPNLLRNESGSPVWFSSSQLHSMALKPVMPEPVSIKGLVFNGVVRIKVMVGRGGDVICMWDAAGHPLMLASAVRAAHDWKFKPKIENRKVVEFVGTLELPVSANGNGL